ncbi:hypothetical protein [Actinokineospora sp. HUAS TT18]|uniref:hypothetical protein n=1 Tax=Actinokineospora sp. HUAS TT18 TaxID=3447451 RepID=UPI003F523B96
MTYPRPRTGVYATVAGQELEAVSYPENGVVTLRGGRVVPLSECDRVDEVTTLVNYRGHECQVIGIGDDGTVGLYYVGPHKADAAADGFVQIDPGTWAKNVEIGEVSRYRERHTDLLFPAWAAG